MTYVHCGNFPLLEDLVILWYSNNLERPSVAFALREAKRVVCLILFIASVSI